MKTEGANVSAYQKKKESSAKILYTIPSYLNQTENTTIVLGKEKTRIMKTKKKKKRINAKHIRHGEKKESKKREKVMQVMPEGREVNTMRYWTAICSYVGRVTFVSQKHISRVDEVLEGRCYLK